MPITYPYIQYGGIWTTSQATDAVAAGTWAVPPQPHLFSWGANIFGALALGNTTYYSSPKQVGSLTDWQDVSVCTRGGFYIRTNGTLWSWGQNNMGQLGLGNTTYYSSPKQIGALTTWLSVSSGYRYGCAIKSDGTLWSWGRNHVGQLGLNNTTYYSSPKQIGSDTNWQSVVCRSHTLAIKTDGTLWAWGQNNYGQLGLGNTTNYSSPTQVGSLTNWLYVSCGNYSTVSIKTNGTIWAWGFNSQGQLGKNNITNYSSPVQIGALTTWSKLSAATGNFSSAIKTDGTLWTWGGNQNGQLGLGNTTNYSSPKQVGSLTNWSIVSGSSGGTFCAAIKTDGTLWSWGNNSVGQLGLNNTTYYSSPKQVGSLTTWSKLSSGNFYVFGVAKT